MWSTEQKRVGDPVLAAVADQQHVDVPELGVAVGAARDALVQRRGRLVGGRARLPVGVLRSPRGSTCSSRQKTARRSPAGS